MTRHIVVGLIAVLAVADLALATCKCGDVGGCVTRSCAGFNPGSGCLPPLAGVCTIAKGEANDAVCCCRCRKPKAPATGASVGACADHYASLLDDVGLLSGLLAGCQMPKLDKAATMASKHAEAGLVKAESACQVGNATKEKKIAAHATANAVKLKQKLKKLEAKGTLAPGCATAYENLVDQLVTGAGMPGGVTTTTTTSTTTTTVGGRAVTLGHQTGSFAPSSVICLSRITGGCVAAAAVPNCACVHLHQTISIDGTGSYTDPEIGFGDECGHGCVAPAAGCGVDMVPPC